MLGRKSYPVQIQNNHSIKKLSFKKPLKITAKKALLHQSKFSTICVICQDYSVGLLSSRKLDATTIGVDLYVSRIVQI
ncbi:hypothetical protein Leryth_002573 [Lithospermum erythrorhizon]|nr:hypothetical protein Leryth_002573 [Lithospermum erythrorhizon]